MERQLARRQVQPGSRRALVDGSTRVPPEALVRLEACEAQAALVEGPRHRVVGVQRRDQDGAREISGAPQLAVGDVVRLDGSGRLRRQSGTAGASSGRSPALWSPRRRAPRASGNRMRALRGRARGPRGSGSSSLFCCRDPTPGRRDRQPKWRRPLSSHFHQRRRVPCGGCRCAPSRPGRNRRARRWRWRSRARAIFSLPLDNFLGPVRDS